MKSAFVYLYLFYHTDNGCSTIQRSAADTENLLNRKNILDMINLHFDLYDRVIGDESKPDENDRTASVFAEKSRKEG